jgi:hypothetical protein
VFCRVLFRSVVGVAMAQREGWAREGCAEIDRSPVQTTCWSKTEVTTRRTAIRQQGTEGLGPPAVVFAH